MEIGADLINGSVTYIFGYLAIRDIYERRETTILCDLSNLCGYFLVFV